jgi:hypothetical protein
MAMPPKILSLSFDAEKLQRRESAMRAHGFEVKSVYGPGQARFEIEMGTCGIFVTCRQVPDIVNRDLIDLFRRYCPRDGLVVLITADAVSSKTPYEPKADILLSESQDPDGITPAIQAFLGNTKEESKL